MLYNMSGEKPKFSETYNSVMEEHLDDSCFTIMKMLVICVGLTVAFLLKQQDPNFFPQV
jgi:hypothetical protein